MSQTFLETGEQRFLVAGLDMDHPVGLETGLRYRRGEKIGTRDDPEHLSLCPRGNPGREHRRRRPVDGAIAAAGDLMQASEPQPASRQSPVDLGQAERQNLAGAASNAPQVRDALLKFGNNRACRTIGHEFRVS